MSQERSSKGAEVRSPVPWTFPFLHCKDEWSWQITLSLPLSLLFSLQSPLPSLDNGPSLDALSRPRPPALRTEQVSLSQKRDTPPLMKPRVQNDTLYVRCQTFILQTFNCSFSVSLVHPLHYSLWLPFVPLPSRELTPTTYKLPHEILNRFLYNFISKYYITTSMTTLKIYTLYCSIKIKNAFNNICVTFKKMFNLYRPKLILLSFSKL